ncbi:hypothetical protein PTKIN_Ptkin01aG0044400 [Pterospermum kingtungense]
MTLEEDLVKLRDELQLEAQCIPNMTHPNVPIGGEDSSKLRNMVGSPRIFDFPVKDHLQIGKELDLFDFDAAAEVSGSKFYYLKNEAGMLELALVHWTLTEVMKRGFTPLRTPESSGHLLLKNVASNLVEKICRYLVHRIAPTIKAADWEFGIVPSATSTEGGKAGLATTKFVHTLNATACAVPRMLENFQQEVGSVIHGWDRSHIPLNLDRKDSW